MTSLALLQKTINRRPVVLFLALITIVFAILGEGAIGFLTLIVLTICLLGINHWNWSLFGMHKLPKASLRFFVKLFLSAFVLITIALLARLALVQWVGPQDLSSFNFLRGNLKMYLITLIQVWVLAAFFEEFVFRGYFLQQFERLLEPLANQKIIAALISSVIFGIAHAYQGITGMILTGIVGLGLCLIFYREKRNLWPCVLVHGIVDTVFLTLVYTNTDAYLGF